MITPPSHQKKAVLLVNLGSPDQPEPAQVKQYLDQFLMDHHVIQLPWLIRRMIVSLFVLPTRPKASAEAYQSIWTLQGSPLLVLSRALQAAIQQQVSIPVALAMRYGQPSLESQLNLLLQHDGIEEILLFPLYPHFADSTITTVLDKVTAHLKAKRSQVKLHVVPPFYADEHYINALVASAQAYLQQDYDHLIFSYHGLPELHIKKLDTSKKHCLVNKECCSQPHPAHKTCYRHQVFETTRCFVEKSGIASDKYSIAFQSRLGKAKWLEPNTEDIIRQQAAKGAKKILVICPAFVTDCLETLEEIAIRGKQVFLDAGGEELTLIPCLNTHPEWITFTSSIANNFPAKLSQ